MAETLQDMARPKEREARKREEGYFFKNQEEREKKVAVRKKVRKVSTTKKWECWIGRTKKV